MPLDMNPDIRAQWCAALRSGDYQQTTDELRHWVTYAIAPDGYCCLGVLTDLYVKAGNDEEWEDDDGWDHQVWADGELAPPVVEWAGLSSGDPWLRIEPTHKTAAQYNDEGTPFAEIADLIDGGAS